MRFEFEAVDIFSGCGGVSCGLTLAGFKVKAAVEIDRSAVETYQSYQPLSMVKVSVSYTHLITNIFYISST